MNFSSPQFGKSVWFACFFMLFPEMILVLNTDTSVFLAYWYLFSILQIECWYWYFSIWKSSLILNIRIFILYWSALIIIASTISHWLHLWSLGPNKIQGVDILHNRYILTDEFYANYVFIEIYFNCSKYPKVMNCFVFKVIFLCQKSAESVYFLI